VHWSVAVREIAKLLLQRNLFRDVAAMGESIIGVGTVDSVSQLEDLQTLFISPDCTDPHSATEAVTSISRQLSEASLSLCKRGMSNSHSHSLTHVPEVLPTESAWCLACFYKLMLLHFLVNVAACRRV
jgi:hypothetical protein